MAVAAVADLGDHRLVLTGVSELAETGVGKHVEQQALLAFKA